MSVPLAPSPSAPAAQWELVGPAGAPITVVLGGISATRHVAGPDGWWGALAGPGRVLDTDRCQILGIDWQLPDRGVITTADQADRLATVLDELAIDRVQAIVGASYGGMVALAFAARHPERVGRLAVIAAAHEPHPMATAHRVIQRRIVRLGLAAGTPRDGVALARALGITTYRTAEEFAARFEVAPTAHRGRSRFPVEHYLDHGSDRFAEAWSAERYLALSESVDLHAVDPADVTVPLALLGVREDRLVPIWQLHDLQRRAGGQATLEEISSVCGHDAFLTEPALVGAFLARALPSEVCRAA
jgi:homoserine O-acetyltransferase